MSLCVKLLKYNRNCQSTSGGIAKTWLFDGEDFDFTQAAAVGGVAAPYTAISLRDGADPEQGALMFPVTFDKKSAEYTFTHSRNGCSVKYEHRLEFQLSELSQLLTNWNKAVDAAGCCCGIGIVILMNNGKIFIMGEKYVNDEVLPVPLEMQQNGSTGTSGKLMEDFSGQTVVMLGEFNRALYEYTGTVQSIVDLETAP